MELLCSVEEEQVVDDVCVIFLGSDFRIGTVLYELLDRFVHFMQRSASPER